MHDFMLAKEIVDEAIKIVNEKKITKVKKIFVEIGHIAMAHDGYEEHIEDISEENLIFGLESIKKGTILEKTEFQIKKTDSNSWSIVEIEGE